MINKNKPKFIFIVGPTATGKSSLAMQIAQKTQARIVNCDSVQVYRHLQIGSNQPTTEEKAKVPHDLYQYVSPPDETTAGHYQKDFFKLIESNPENQNWIVVGGTGFYFQALEKGQFEIAPIPQELRLQLKEKMQTEAGRKECLRRLAALDPLAIEILHPNDTYRITRALEVVLSGQGRWSELKSEFQKTSFPYEVLKLGMDQERDHLRKIIRARSEKMLADGLEQEVDALIAAGLQDWKPLQSVGYREVLLKKQENRDQEWLLDKITQSTIHLAKRQRTWFQRDGDIQWNLETSTDHLVQLGLRFFLGDRIIV